MFLHLIPRYLLFDKGGVLVHKKAPGPKGKEVRKLFNSYLKHFL